MRELDIKDLTIGNIAVCANSRFTLALDMAPLPLSTKRQLIEFNPNLSSFFFHFFSEIGCPSRPGFRFAPSANEAFAPASEQQIYICPERGSVLRVCLIADLNRTTGNVTHRVTSPCQGMVVRAINSQISIPGLEVGSPYPPCLNCPLHQNGTVLATIPPST